MEKELWPGWKTVGKLGSGGFGRVYRIEKTDLSGTVEAALKVISIPNSPEDYENYSDDGYDEESITAMFRSQLESVVKECQQLSGFRGTSNIVSYEDHKITEHEDGRGWDVYIKMELLTSLPQYYREHPMSEAEVLRLGKDICTALELCEMKNIVHRDIKPQNIFVNEFGNFKLGDFGIARKIEHTTAATKTGSYSYMAPEVYYGKRYNANVDLYSLGLVLFWLLNERRLPFEPVGDAVPTVAMKDAALARRLKCELLPETRNGSPEFNAVIRKCCAADPKERYQTASEMRKALEHVQTQPTVTAVSCSDERTFGVFSADPPQSKPDKDRLPGDDDATVGVFRRGSRDSTPEGAPEKDRSQEKTQTISKETAATEPGNPAKSGPEQNPNDNADSSRKSTPAGKPNRTVSPPTNRAARIDGAASFSWKPVEGSEEYVAYYDEEGHLVRIPATKASYSGMASPPTFRAVCIDGKASFSWDPLAGAEKYLIRMYTSSEDKHLDFCFASTEKTSYSCAYSAYRMNKTRFYELLALATVGERHFIYEFSNVVCLLGTPTVEITRFKKHPKLLWEAVEGADKYLIYRSTGSSPYVLYASTTVPFYTDTEAKAGENYSYQVQAASDTSTVLSSDYSFSVSMKAR